MLDTFDESEVDRPSNRVTSRIHLTRDELRLCAENAKKACIGGESRIREGLERRARLLEDNLAGQIGNAAGCKWWHGNLDDYRRMRERANANPTVGDGGSDLDGFGVDFKLSLMRASPDPHDYRLIVRPHERHAGWVYVQLLMPEITKQDYMNGLDVWLAGWQMDSAFPKAPDSFGPFEGAFVIPVRSLRSCEAQPSPELLAAVRRL